MLINVYSTVIHFGTLHRRYLSIIKTWFYQKPRFMKCAICSTAFHLQSASQGVDFKKRCNLYTSFFPQCCDPKVITIINRFVSRIWVSNQLLKNRDFDHNQRIRIPAVAKENKAYYTALAVTSTF